VREQIIVVRGGPGQNVDQDVARQVCDGFHCGLEARPAVVVGLAQSPCAACQTQNYQLPDNRRRRRCCWMWMPLLLCWMWIGVLLQSRETTIPSATRSAPCWHRPQP
jgi:hypothetical protein